MTDAMINSEQPEKHLANKIVERSLPEGIAFEVPPRGIVRGNPLLILWITFWFLAVAAGTFSFVFARGGLANLHPGQALGAIAFLALFWGIGIGVTLFAVNRGRQRVTIRFANDRLTLATADGLFGNKTSSWPRNQVQYLEVGMCGESENQKSLRQLQIHPVEGKMVGILNGYDPAELDWLVDRLNQCLHLPPRMVRDMVVADVEQPPLNSSLQLQVVGPRGVRISVPPAGLWRGSLGIFAFGIAWSVWIPLAGGGILLFTDVWDSPQGVPVFLMLCGNMAVGIGISLLGYYLGTRRAEIAVAGDRLLIINRGIFANWRREWSRDELSAVRAARSSASSNNKPFMQLQIVPRQGKSVKMLTGRNDQDLAWIATKIRHALNLPAIDQTVPSQRDA